MVIFIIPIIKSADKHSILCFDLSEIPAHCFLINKGVTEYESHLNTPNCRVWIYCVIIVIKTIYLRTLSFFSHLRNCREFGCRISSCEMCEINSYEKVRNIGEGAFGKAILVRCKRQHVNRVIKEINISKVSFDLFFIHCTFSEDVTQRTGGSS